MPELRRLSLTLIVLLLSQPVWAAGWQAGAAKVKITPRQPMWMSGYASRTSPAEGTETDLFAKSLVIQDEAGTKAVVVTLDLVGIPRDVSQKICQALAEKFKIERSQVVLCTSHTHSGPVVGSNLAAMWELDATQQGLIDDYAQELQVNVVQAVSDAVANLAPSKIAWANGRTTFAVNRRTNLEKDVPAVRERGDLVGPVDYDVPVLSVRTPEGKLKAVLFGYACHATVVSFMKWSGDYPGYAQAELEALHPEAVALFFAGCGADQNPLPRREVAIAQKYGKQLAAAVDQTLAGVMTPLTGQLTTRYTEADLEFASLPTREALETAAANPAKAGGPFYESRRAKVLLKQIDSGKPLSPTYPYPVQYWQLGDGLQFVTLGGEVVVDYSLRIKTELGRGHTWVAGYSNDVMAYIPSLRVLKEGGYEGGGSMVYYCLPAHWAPSVEERIMKAVHDLKK